jgi:hypothetical protein
LGHSASLYYCEAGGFRRAETHVAFWALAAAAN